MNINQKKDIKEAYRILDKINRLEPEVEKLSDQRLRACTDIFRRAVKGGTAEEDFLPEAYAVCREAARRTLGKRHFDEQLVGGIVLNSGDIAEMATGEGKTLMATTAAYLNALSGKGVHVVTSNDYLSRRDRDTLDPLYSFLGLKTGCVVSGMAPADRKAAYDSDITYGTSTEFGFDYLRDNMVKRRSDRVQRQLHYVIIDEVDSILIDEARTPLIISGSDPSASVEGYDEAQRFAETLQEKDFQVEEKERQISLTESGVRKAERFFGIENLSDLENIEIHHFILEALKANFIMKKNVDYIVDDGEVKIVDGFTGRIMEGRRFSEGLHQAIEARERVKINPESRTFASITLQNFFRMYEKLSGMSGTAETEADEFLEIYNMNVVRIPTHKPVKRTDHPDLIFLSQKAKWNAVINEIVRVNRTGRPILVGTASVKHSEYLSSLLSAKGIQHTVLNAKNHGKEAEIIAQAGRIGAVTVATNMAGRGTDILLGGNGEAIVGSLRKKRDVSGEDVRGILEYYERQREKVIRLGGLYVIGTERHESRRIDDQLRGRSGRQGDPGDTRFFVAVTDELIRRYSAEEMKKALRKYGTQDARPQTARTLFRLMDDTQKKVEGNNFAIRKNVLKYDDVLNRQRRIIYDQRDLILSGGRIDDIMEDMIGRVAESIVTSITGCSRFPEEWDLQRLAEEIEAEFADIHIVPPESQEERKHFEEDSLIRHITDMLIKNHRKRRDLGGEVFDLTERSILLQVVDRLWADHLDAMEQMRKGIGLMSLGQKDPAVEYAKQGSAMFERLNRQICRDTVKYCFQINVGLAGL